MNQHDGSPISKKNTYRKRKKTLKKKAEELSILCDIPVALITVEPTGKVDIWPQDRQLVDEILRQYLIKTINSPQTVQFSVKRRNPNGGRMKKKKRKLMYDTWPSELDFLPEHALVQIFEDIEKKEKILDEIILREEDEFEEGEIHEY